MSPGNSNVLLKLRTTLLEGCAHSLMKQFSVYLLGSRLSSDVLGRKQYIRKMQNQEGET